MGYELVAFIASDEAFQRAAPPAAEPFIFPLAPGLGLLPRCAFIEIDDEWARLASAGTVIADVRASYFGGVGSQSATIWQDGARRYRPMRVNQALERLGVSRSAGLDEWNRVGLGRYRDTEVWAAEAVRLQWQQDPNGFERMVQALTVEWPDDSIAAEIRERAATDLGANGDPAAVSPLQDAFASSTDEGVRIAAAKALAIIGGPGIEFLAERLRGADAGRPFALLNALGHAGSRAAGHADAVAAFLGASDPSTRSQAARTLGSMGSAARSAVPWLARALRDRESFVRSDAAEALGAMGAAAVDARADLKALVSDPEDYVRQSARSALAAIDAGSPAE